MLSLEEIQRIKEASRVENWKEFLRLWAQPVEETTPVPSGLSHQCLQTSELSDAEPELLTLGS